MQNNLNLMHFLVPRIFREILKITHLRAMSVVKKRKFCVGNVPDTERVVWVDLEMTGLEVETDHIIEMACLITNAEMEVIAEGPNLIINQPDSVLDSMNDWCKEHHGDSGLTEAVRKSKISLQQAEIEMLSFIRQHTPRGKCPLAGNSIHADKRFLDKYMPQFMEHLHYRIIDVSTIKELCKRWYPDEYERTPRKSLAHRAMQDIKESIKEINYYRQTIFKPQNTFEETSG